MNRTIRRLAVACFVMFAALLLNANYIQFVNAADLNDDTGNRRVIDAEFSRRRGPILVQGAPVAKSAPVDDRFNFLRRYPQGRQYAHVTGYYSYLYGDRAVESSQNDVLAGSDPSLLVRRVIDVATNEQAEGGSVVLTLDRAAQAAAFAALGDIRGAVVALEPDTGRVLALVSHPTYNPSRLARHDLSAVQRSWKRLTASDTGPIYNRATQASHPPGSTFKLVTAAAALGTGRYTPQTLVPGPAALDLPLTDTPLVNESGSACGSTAEISLTQALAVSCNTAFGSVGLDIGAEVIREQAARFGFGEDHLEALDTNASNFPANPDAPQTALSAIGQFEVSATPLQMAMVAAGIANDGEVMRPYIVDITRAPDLQPLEVTDPEVLHEAMDAEDANALTQMMVEVVAVGTGTNAQIPDVAVAGKTGTAQSAAGRPPYAWFVSFAPAEDPQVAVAVMIENAHVPREAISGNALAAPIAKAVMEAVIRR